VDIVLAWAGADARLLDASRETAAGCVVAAMGRGNVPVAMFEGVRRWAEQGKPIVITSRTGEGRVGTTYAYPGAGRRLVEAGAIMGGALRPTQARLELMIALGAGYDASQLGALFDAA
jgi:L-asparaginase